MKSVDELIDHNQQLSESLRRRAHRDLIPTDNFQALGKWLDADQPARMHGWTTVAPVPLESPVILPALDILDDLHTRFGNGEYSQHPLSSLHMTVLPGFAEMDMCEDYPDWATNSRTMAEVSIAALERIKAAAVPVLSKPLEVKVKDFQLNNHAEASATVVPASDEDASWLKGAREALAAAVGYRSPQHDTYRHHITFAYRLTPGCHEQTELNEISERYTRSLQDAGTIELETPVFSIFETMLSFPGVYELGRKGR